LVNLDSSQQTLVASALQGEAVIKKARVQSVFLSPHFCLRRDLEQSSWCTPVLNLVSTLTSPAKQHRSGGNIPPCLRLSSKTRLPKLHCSGSEIPARLLPIRITLCESGPILYFNNIRCFVYEDLPLPFRRVSFVLKEVLPHGSFFFILLGLTALGDPKILLVFLSVNLQVCRRWLSHHCHSP